MTKTLVYQMYPISWENAHSLNDWDTPIGRMCDHLGRVEALGCDYVWLSPIYSSPRRDHGYDVADYLKVDDGLGTLDDIVYFIDFAHRLGLKVLFDLVLNHTSIEHAWFTDHPEYYCWSDNKLKGWRNLFDGGSTWTFDPKMQQYYLHLFYKDQADLNWFPNGELNYALVHEFRRIVEFWAEKGVDGFRLDVPQAINKDFTRKNQDFADLLFGDQAIEVINAIFRDCEDLFLISECFDPTDGTLVNYYAKNTPIDFVLDVDLKEKIAMGKEFFLRSLERHCVESSSFMLDLESHDSPRFCSRANDLNPEDMIWWMFNSSVQGICLYQGQELGLLNPSRADLSDEEMMDLDIQTFMRALRGEDLEDLRLTSRANARVPLPLAEYERQESDPSSYLNLTKHWIRYWKENI